MTGRERAMGAVTIVLLIVGIATAVVRSGSSDTTASPPFGGTPTPIISEEPTPTPTPTLISTPTPSLPGPRSSGAGSTAKPVVRPTRLPSDGSNDGSMPDTGVPGANGMGAFLILAAIALGFGARKIKTMR